MENTCKNLLLRERNDLHFVTLAMMAAVMVPVAVIIAAIIVGGTTFATRSSILLDEMIIDITS